MALSGRCRPVDGRPVNRFPLGESLVALVGGKMLGEKLPGYSRVSVQFIFDGGFLPHKRHAGMAIVGS